MKDLSPLHRFLSLSQDVKMFTINIKGKIIHFDRPAVMGILNITPDSFYSQSRCWNQDSLSDTAEHLVNEGADIIDIGGYSSRPGAEDVTPEEEIRRLSIGISAIRKIAPAIPISVDTFRADVAKAAILDLGADIINDISAGDLDRNMFDTVSELNVPYIAMHMRGTASDMQSYTDYTAQGGVTNDIISKLAEKIDRLEQKGVSDIIVDPGFGFAKTTEQNFEVLHNLSIIGSTLNRPVLVGVSRKSMIYKTLGITPGESLNGTTAINVMALERGASILRVHDVTEARQAIGLWTKMKEIS